MLVDTHCHINSLTAAVRSTVIEACQSGFLLIDSSINIATSKESVALSSSNPAIYSALGFHPFSAKEYTPDIFDAYRALITKKTVAIGEIGLDETAGIAQELQEKIFREFLAFAKTLGLPVMLHNRIQGERMLEILDEFYASYDKVIFHCYSYDTGMLRTIVERHGFVSFSLNILRKKPAIMRSLAQCPAESLLLETDSPYMKIDGRATLPMDIKEVYRCAAAVRGVAQAELEALVLNNTQRAFSISL